MSESNIVDVVLERKGSMMFEGRKMKIPNDAANIIRDFIEDSDREKFVVLCLNVKNECTAMQVVYTGSLNGVFKVALFSCKCRCGVQTSIRNPPERVKKRLVKIGEINIKYRF